MRPLTRPWSLAAGAIALLMLAPFAALVVTAWPGSVDHWTHLVAYVLPPAIIDTAMLLGGVAVVAGTLGTTLAWLVTAYDFPGRRLFSGALLLPLAMPTYIVAYAYLDLLHPVGVVQDVVRTMLGYETPREFRLPDIRSMPGCILLLGFVLYPYVYLPTRAMFLLQAANLLDTARTLGAGRMRTFLRVALPLARPAVAVGLSLALMEALNDIGASEFLGVRTLTVSIYTTWVTRSDLAGAAQIALAMLCVVVALGALERWARRQRRYANDAQQPRPLVAHRLSGTGGALALAACALPVVIGFLAPTAYLVGAALERVQFAGVADTIVRGVRNTVVLSLVATSVAVTAGVAIAYAARLARGRLAAAMTTVAALGYATPGTVVALGLLPVVTGFDAIVSRTSDALIGATTGMLLLGSGAALIYAYVVRFLAIPAGGTDAALDRIATSVDEAAATLGQGATRRLWLIHLPIIRPAITTAGLLVFVDCMKELPATLLLRPIGFETLATLLYGEAARGTYEDGAIAALLIVCAGIGPVWLLARLGQRVHAEPDWLNGSASKMRQ
jgi:iron(III) transport system permease protein